MKTSTTKRPIPAGKKPAAPQKGRGAAAPRRAPGAAAATMKKSDRSAKGFGVRARKTAAPANRAATSAPIAAGRGPIAPAEVHATLARHMLADGYDLVLDLEKSKGRRLHDARTGRWYLDMFSFFATLPSCPANAPIATRI